MIDSTYYRELGNGKRYNTLLGRTMSENRNNKENVAGTPSGNVEGEFPDIYTLTPRSGQRANQRVYHPEDI